LVLFSSWLSLRAIIKRPIAIEPILTGYFLAGAGGWLDAGTPLVAGFCP
jgi:hypothetical protein